MKRSHFLGITLSLFIIFAGVLAFAEETFAIGPSVNSDDVHRIVGTIFDKNPQITIVTKKLNKKDIQKQRV